MPTLRASEACPCGTGQAYGLCCRPFHQGSAEAPTPEALMRSRFSAFALKQLEYLLRTLHSTHPDRQRPAAEALRELRAATQAPRYVGLTVVASRDAGPAHPAQVIFCARVFVKGKDVSFAERSDFAREGDAWRYVGGEARRPDTLPRPMAAWTFQDFDG